MWKLNILKSRRRVFKSQYREMKNITLNKCELLFSSGITDTNFKHTLWWTLEKKSFNPFHVIGLLLYFLKTSEKL